MYNPEELVGITLSERYHVLEKIGRGGMAMVYKAHDKVLDRDVAIKILRETFEGGNTIVENFIKEARSSASLVHSNVVSVYDVCEFEGLNYMVMELVDGVTLKEYIKNNPRLPWQEACDYAIQIGQGIQAAHERGIIHRDIKPQNIIMAPGGVLKVTDFGIAKAMESDKSIAGGTALGSVHYISPEQAKGGYTDFRSDIYSLGVVLYEMLAGRVPFDGDSPVSVALMHIEEEPLNVKCVNMDVPADLAYVTMKAMSREQGKRYQDMQELLEDLRAVLADESLPSRENDESRKAEPQGDFFDSDEENESIADSKSDVRVKKKAKNIVKKNRADRNAVIGAIITAVTVILIAAAVCVFVLPKPQKTVPDFVGMTIEEAKQAADKSIYKLCDDSEFEYAFSDTIPRNSVVSQIPEAGSSANKSEPVKLIISKGKTDGNIVLPELDKFSSVDEAMAYLTEAGLKYDFITEVSDKVAAGEIIRQIPLAGTHLKENDKVKIYVSRGAANGAAVKQESKVTENEEYEVTAEPEQITETTEENVAEENTVQEETPQTPTENNSEIADGGEGAAPIQFYTVKIPDSVGEQVHMKIIANGAVVHEAVHAKTEGSVTVEIPGEGSVSIQVYIDGAMAQDKTVTF